MKQFLYLDTDIVNSILAQAEKGLSRKSGEKNKSLLLSLTLRKRYKKKACKRACLQAFCGGELGIRTLETFRSTAFRVLHLRPLGQLSVSIFVRFSFQKFAQKFVGEKTGETAKNIRF